MKRANLRTKQSYSLPFFPRLVYNSITIDITPPTTLRIDPGNLVGENVALSGKKETLHIRSEHVVEMFFERLSKSIVDALETYRDDWGSLGKQAALTLDSSGNGTGTWEYDNYNTFFDKAELDIQIGVKPVRGRLRRSIFDLRLVFRQGK